jgi:hypothetical protein
MDWKFEKLFFLLVGFVVFSLFEEAENTLERKVPAEDKV